MPAWAQPAAPARPADTSVTAQFRTATVTVAAPIYVQPNASVEALRVAKEGSTLRLIEQNAEWTTVEFQDPQYGRRIGYIQTTSLRPIANPSQQIPLDLSVPAESLQPPPATRFPSRRDGGMPTKYKVWGSVLVGLGAYYFVSYAVTPANDVICVLDSCVSTDTLRTTWLALGAGATAGGVAVFAAGARAGHSAAPSVLVGPTGISVRKTIDIRSFHLGWHR